MVSSPSTVTLIMAQVFLQQSIKRRKFTNKTTTSLRVIKDLLELNVILVIHDVSCMQNKIFTFSMQVPK